MSLPEDVAVGRQYDAPHAHRWMQERDGREFCAECGKELRDPSYAPCEACRGTGEWDDTLGCCPSCDGTGEIAYERGAS